MKADQLEEFMSEIGVVRETRTENCEQHGEFESQERRMIGRRFVWSKCPQCVEEEQAESAKLIEEAQERQRENERRQRYDKHMQRLGIAPRYYDCRVDSFTPKNAEQEKVKNLFGRLISLSQQPPENRSLDKCFIITGDVGVGKTHLLAALAIEMENDTLTTRYTTAMRMIRSVRETYGGNGSESVVVESFVKPDVLLLDEVGVQSGTDAERVVLYDILNRRYEQMKMTVVATNLDMEKLRPLLGDRIMRRLTDNGLVMSLGGN